ncbi:MAG: DUF1295 domain-containing protein [Candidatus Heimdallarchaeaceae archaeon]|jgi:steroid 5-alpha reductase family enzyme
MDKAPVLRRQNMFVSYLIIILSYAVAITVAIVLGIFLSSKMHTILVVFICDIAATLVIYSISTAMKNTSIYDPYWSVAPIVIAIYWLILGSTQSSVSLKQILVFALVSFWGIRLTYNWSRGWKGLGHEDWRYTKYRLEQPKLFWFINLTGLQLMPTLLVFLGCLSLYPVLTSGVPEFTALDIMGLIIVILAIFLETIADEQLRIFTKVKEKGEVLSKGLWRFTRHPNYLGEISFWWGLWFFALSVSASSYWWMIVGPVSMVVLFVIISIPMMEKHLKERYPKYEEYQKKVSMLLPWFSRKK